jgi:hypothetical protein
VEITLQYNIILSSTVPALQMSEEMKIVPACLWAGRLACQMQVPLS